MAVYNIDQPGVTAQVVTDATAPITLRVNGMAHECSHVGLLVEKMLDCGISVPENVASDGCIYEPAARRWLEQFTNAVKPDPYL